jgi:23S rRNA (cytidine1920-2'-O)/16S rRNA (cytidine1409-2'-O)-methyltransferase
VAGQRLDTALAERGLFPSRAAAAASIRAGEVRIGRDGPFALKPGQLVEAGDELIIEGGPRYVSRGGIKLQNALDELGVAVTGLDCLDIGASTGGFTDCLLQRGAERVAAVDVGYGQLAASLRDDPRVTVLERVNARALACADLPFAPDLVVIDVSFISLAKVLPAVLACAAPVFDCLAMVKPQFELGPGRVGRGGVVRSAGDRAEAIVAVAEAGRALGATVLGFASSGLPGPAGNRETFVWLAEAGRAGGVDDLAAALAEAGA